MGASSLLFEKLEGDFCNTGIAVCSHPKLVNDSVKRELVLLDECNTFDFDWTNIRTMAIGKLQNLFYPQPRNILDRNIHRNSYKKVNS